MATHSGILAWEISWIEEPGGLQSMRSQKARHDLVTKQQQQQSKDTALLKDSLLCAKQRLSVRHTEYLTLKNLNISNYFQLFSIFSIWREKCL